MELAFSQFRSTRRCIKEAADRSDLQVSLSFRWNQDGFAHPM